MNSHAADSRPSLSGGLPEGSVHLLRWTLLCAAGAAMAVASFLLTRRWAGAEFRPLERDALLPAVLATAGGLWLLHRAWRWGSREANGGRWPFEPWCQVLVTVIALSAGWSLAPTGSALVVFASWAALLGGEVWWWGGEFLRFRGRQPETGNSWLSRLFRGSWRQRAGQVASPAAPSPTPSAKLTVAEPDEQEPLDEASEDTLPPNVSQRMTRAVDETGAEVIYGAVRCEFAAGQRQENVHLAFCPPLSATPELSAEQLDGPVAKIQPSLVQPFGAALEVRLPAPSPEPTRVLIQFYACVPQAS